MRISDWSSDVCSSDLARRALQLVGERIGSVGIGLGVRHFKDAGDAAKHGGAAARLKVFLLLQPRLAEMNLRVDRAWKDDKTAAVDDFACIARCADRGDFAVPHADAGLRQSTGRDHAAVLDRKGTRLN